MAITSLVEKTQKWARLKPSSRVLVLVSGGADSMLALEVMARLQKQVGFFLKTAHFNFELRGEESWRDSRFVQEFCGRARIPCEVVAAPLAKGPGIQERARQVRLDYLKNQTQPFSHIVTGHQQTDQVETLLMRIHRGTGLKGLCGMTRLKTLGQKRLLLRPLIDLSRGQVHELAASAGIPFIHDSSNDGQDYWRNRVRSQWLPAIAREDPALIPQLLALSRLAQIQFARDEKVARRFVAAPQAAPYHSLKTYQKLPQEIRFLILENLFASAGFRHQFEEKHFREMESLFLRNRNLEKDFGQAHLSVSYGGFAVVAKNAATSSSIYRTIQNAAELRGLFSLTSGRLNPSLLSFPLVLRNWRPGDRFCPPGFKSGHKKISDYFINCKIPFLFRKQALVLCQGDEIIHLLGSKPAPEN